VAKYNPIDPTRDFDPENLLNFVELGAFTFHWSRLGLTDGDLTALQMLIMRQPTGSPVIRGTSIVLLATVYAKNEESDLTEAQKRAMANKVGEIEKYLREYEYYGF
jgi:hypothetical protein